MNNVTPFTPRADTSGWTEAERERLADLAARLEGAFGRVHTAFGVSDKGEPWCVITDDNDEVIIHAARINGQFVIHHAADDVLRVGDTLWSACDRLLGDDWREERDDVVVSLSRRQAQSVLAIAVLADFVYEVTDAEAASAPEMVSFKAEAVSAALATLAFAAAPAANAEPDSAAPLPAPAHAEGLVPAAAEETAPAAAQLDDGDQLQPIAALGDDTNAATQIANASSPAPEGEVRVVEGGDGNDVLRGGEGRDVLIGGAGNDTALGGGGDDRLVGGQDNDVLLGEAGDDQVYGNGGGDTVDGGEGDDTVRGGQGDDSVSGGSGDDVVAGDKGDDTVTGGEGADTFLFFTGAGLDRVVDFDRGQGDRVVIEDHSAHTVSQEGDDTVIELNPADRLVLVNVQLSTLSEGWLVE